MINTPKCYKRGCIHFIGVKQSDGTEETENIVCSAYPNGIPADIAYGDDLHLEVRPDQDNEIIFEGQQ